SIPHECLKQVLFEMLNEAGVTLQMHTMAVGVVKENNKVRGVITESKSGREVIMAQAVIDATGDGDIAAFAGVPYQLGREEDNACQPVTLMFRIGGVDYTRAAFPHSFETLVDLPKGEIQALGRLHLPAPAGHVLLYRNLLPGEVTVNMTNVTGINGIDVRDLTRAEIICREQMEKIVLFLREYVPGYEKCYLSASGDMVGVRETRHFKGILTLTAEDIVEATVFDDWIATRNYFNFDIHNIKGAGLDSNGLQKHFKAKGKYTIPYRACVPENIDGLLLSGRNISGTHKAHSNYRVMGICLNIGVGVGTAAAVAVKSRCELKNVDITEVQQILLKNGTEI
ncbi:MAG: FAD-dependent oxidoreductase, partial [Lentisphaeria bacterium]|nr:FAD-dependent oxidoreductase [Lentisphaeria bacterium]